MTHLVHAWPLLAGAAILWGGYRVGLRLWPWGPCPKCGGSGRSRGSNSRRHGLCGRCGGSGRQRRPGAKKE
jgi:DnaJ-class molecular chaperone